MKLLKRAASLVLATSLVAGVSACSQTADPISSVDQTEILAKKNSTKAGAKKWTVMVHLAADNNLYPFGLEDVNEMEAGLASDDVNLIVLFDGEKKGDSTVYKIKKDSMNTTIISEEIDNPIAKHGSEIDSGSKEVAKKFVDWAVDAFPAEHYGHIIWNHGGGFVMNGTQLKLKNGKTFVAKPVKNPAISAPGFNTNNFAWDDNGSHMLSQDLPYIYSDATKKIGKKLDVLDFDACLMAHVEGAYELKDSVDYLVASEKTEPGKGNPYKEMMEHLSKNPSMSGADFAKTIVKDYAASYAGGSAGTSRITKSATDNAKVVSLLEPAMSKFAVAMNSNLAKDKAALKNLRSKTASFENYDCGDIGHFAKMVAADANVSPDVKAAANAVVSAVQASVIENANSANPNAMGLMVYFPSSGSLKSQFGKLQFGKDSKWGDFLGGFVK